MKTARALGLVLLVAAGCADDGLGFGVALTVVVDDSVQNDAFSRIAAYRIESDGGESYERVIVLGRAPERQERIVYRPASDTRALTLAVTALATDGAIIAAGRTPQLALEATKTTVAEVRLAVDGGVDGGFDAAPGDEAHGGCAGAYCFTFERDADDSSSLLAPAAGCSVKNGPGAHGGLAYLSCTTTGSDANYRYAQPVGNGSGVVAYRAWMRVDTKGNTIVFGNFMGLSDAANHWIFVGTDGVSKVSGKYTSASEALQLASTQSVDTAGAWRCVEMVVTRPSTVAFYYEGQLVKTASDAYIPTAYQEILVGINKPTGVAITVDVDDMVVGDHRIGCN